MPSHTEFADENLVLTTSFKMDDELASWLRYFARKQRRSVGFVIREILRESMREDQKQQENGKENHSS